MPRIRTLLVAVLIIATFVVLFLLPVQQCDRDIYLAPTIQKAQVRLYEKALESNGWNIDATYPDDKGNTVIEMSRCKPSTIAYRLVR